MRLFALLLRAERAIYDGYAMSNGHQLCQVSKIVWGSFGHVITKMRKTVWGDSAHLDKNAEK
jgi:hypothetical protein